MSLVAEALSRGLVDGFHPDPNLPMSEWADEFRQLVAESGTKEHGRWRTDRTPYLRDIMNDMSPHSPVRHVVVMKGAQIGATEGLIVNGCGYIIHVAPGPAMCLYPTVELGEDFSKDRFSPMVKAMAVLRSRVREKTSRGSGNTILEKKFRGGFLKIAGANSAATLRSKPIKYLFRDEIDAFPDDVDGEGDPLALSEARTNTFTSVRKIVDLSTPTLDGASKIATLYGRSDQRRYFIPCPECGHMDFLSWRDASHHSIEFSDHDPKTVHMLCGSCRAEITERHKTAMLAGGEWRPTAESNGKIHGYHISSLYSPLGWYPWEEIAERFLIAKKDPSKLKVWVNTDLGETWKDEGNGPPKEEVILARAEQYPADVPSGVGTLVMSVDVQADRLEWVVKGYGADEESWLIARGAIPGDPEKDDVWVELDRLRAQAWQHESGQRFRADITTVDSGYKAERVYRYCRMRVDQRVYAVKGGNQTGIPLVGRPTANNVYRARLYMLCTDTGKDIVQARLRIPPPQKGVPAPGYMHLPIGIDRDYVEQLTSERSYPQWVPRQGTVYRWKKLEGRRNEMLDCEVYALAGLYIMGFAFVRGLRERAHRWAVPVLGLERPAGEGAVGAAVEGALASQDEPAIPTPALKASRRPQRGGWIRNWRR